MTRGTRQPRQRISFLTTTGGVLRDPPRTATKSGLGGRSLGETWRGAPPGIPGTPGTDCKLFKSAETYERAKHQPLDRS